MLTCDRIRERYAAFRGRRVSINDPDFQTYEDCVEHIHECLECRDWDMAQEVESQGFELSQFPCVHIAYRVTNRCDEHLDEWDCPDVLVVATKTGYAIPIRDGGRSFATIDFCPWCGIALA